jgi:hypothetical protein
MGVGPVGFSVEQQNLLWVSVSPSVRSISRIESPRRHIPERGYPFEVEVAAPGAQRSVVAASGQLHQDRTAP